MNVPSSTGGARHHAPVPPFAFIVVTGLFFAWGFVTCLNDILVPHLRAVFHLSYFLSSLVQFAFFGAYFLVSLPAGWLVSRWGYQRGMVVGLVACGTGALLFYPAAARLSYPLFLAALFVLASGITVLQVAANPYVAVLGPSETASSRLNLSQAFNSLGTTLAPWVGGALILGGTAGLSPVAQAALVQRPYLGIAAILLGLAVVIRLLPLPAIPEVEGEAERSMRGVLRERHLVLAAAGIFFYVGAEVSVGSYLISFLEDPGIGNLPAARAASCVSLFWGGALLGRFVGAALLRRIAPQRLLAAYAVAAIGLLGLALAGHGWIAAGSVLALGFFNSIMFPNLFTLGIAGLGHRTGQGSSVLVMAIVGGALIPMAMGRAADAMGIHAALGVPLLCYLYLLYFGVSGWRPSSMAE